MITEERFREIMEDEDVDFNCDDDNAFLGLAIIRKYLPKSGIEGADHDIIYSVDVDEIIEAGITEDDAIALNKLNWMIDESGDGLACYV